MLQSAPERHPSTSPASRLARRGLLLLWTLLHLAVATTAQDYQGSAALEPGKPVRRELLGGLPDSYRIELAADQYLRIVADQRNADIVLAMYGPNGKQIIEINNTKGSQGSEYLFLITTVAGRYRLEVRPAAKDTPAAGGYEVRIEELRAATTQDKNRMMANFAFMQAEALRARGTPNSLRESADKFRESLSLWQAVGDARNEAATLLLLGKVLDDLGEKQQALDAYMKALVYWRGAKDARGLAAALGFIGKVYDDLGRKREALDKYEEALALWRSVPNDRGAAAVLNNIGKIYSDLGEKQTALDKYKEALALWRAVGDSRGQAATLSNIGSIYRSLNLPQQALTNYKEALALWKAIKDIRGEAAILNNIGKGYDDLGEKKEALKNYKDALELSRTAGDYAGQALALNNIGGLHDQADEPGEALANYREALALWQRIGDPQREAAAHTNIGKVHYDLGDKAAAVESHKEALALWVKAGDRGGQATTLANLAFTERGRGNLRESLARIEEALAIVESLRTKVVSQELRSSYFAAVQAYYEFDIDLLMQLHKQQPSAGYDGRALQISERARARSLLELLAEARVDIYQGVPPQLVKNERSLQSRLNALAQRQVELRAEPHTAEQAKAIAGEIETLIVELQQVRTEVRQASPRYAALTQPEPLALRDIQTSALDANTMLLEYSLGAERSYLWAVTPTSITSHELPRRAVLEATAKQFVELLASPVTAGESDERRLDMLTSGRDLSRMLLGPVASQLGGKRLVIVSEGALQYLPFAALPDPSSVGRGRDGQQPLITRHEIVSLPSISIMPTLHDEALKRPPAPLTLAVLADPVFSPEDVRVKSVMDRTSTARPRAAPAGVGGAAGEAGASTREGGGDELPGAGLERLNGSRKEAQGILAMVPADKALAAFDFDASRTLATSPALTHYRYIHFATHGRLDDLHPELSAIVLSLVERSGAPQNGYLRLNEIYNLQLPSDLVVLSGCETGLGKDTRGEGLVGLARGFMYAGAPRVVATLWRVDDEATAELMIRFYRGLLKEKKRPAEALRAAQIYLMKQKPWQSPHHWAAFMLQGEWR